jgi:hypothetical protein
MSKSGLLDPTTTALPDANDLPSAREETGLTLRRLEVWVDEWRLRMRMMSACVEGCQEEDAQGGALVSLINGYTDHGDPFVRKFTDQMLEEVRSIPYFHLHDLNWGDRSPNLSSRRYTAGSSMENCKTPMPSSSSRRTRTLRTFSITQRELRTPHSPATAGSRVGVTRTETWSLMGSSYGKGSISSGRRCSLVL